MKSSHDRLIQAKKTAALVKACSVSIDQAIAITLSITEGTVFDVKLKDVAKHTVWRVKLLKGSERVKVYVDAHSGRILEAKAEVTVHEPFVGTTPDCSMPI
jgi:uncharacterized membrane protein YkoI